MKPNIGETERTICAIAGGLLTLYGITRNSKLGIFPAAAGALLILRGATGHCPVTEALGANEQDAGAAPWNRQIHVRQSIAITKPREEVYAFWRKLENLPRFMKHLESVTQTGESQSHWVARGPGGAKVEWDAMITEERPNELLAWESVDGSQVPNRGAVTFEDAPGGRGTEIHVELSYNPPAGVLGAAIAKLFAEEPKGQIADDLRRLRALLETGEVPTIEGQPSDKLRKAKGLLKTRFQPDTPPEVAMR